MENILVIGKGFIGTELDKFDEFTTIHRKDLATVLLEETTAVVNTAAIVGYKKCKDAGYDEVMKSNVSFAYNLAQNCSNRGLPFFQFSTTGIYAQQICTTLEGFIEPRETSPTFPHNLYTASKMLMEQALHQFNNTYIFRIPWFKQINVFKNRAQNWNYVQNTWTSMVYSTTLKNAIISVVHQNTPSGIYNIADETVFFPHFIENIIKAELEICSEHDVDMTSSIPISTQKAKLAGILI